MSDQLLVGRHHETDIYYVTGTRQVLINVHDPSKCEGRKCVIHEPSRHPLVNAPTHWRVKEYVDKDYTVHLVQVMERICSCGVFHPDPDDVVFIAHTKGEKAASFAAAHECCDQECCRQ